MQDQNDDLTFEGAWNNQFKDENKNPEKKVKSKNKTFEKPTFRGKRDVIEKRSKIIVSSKKSLEATTKNVEVVDQLSSKEGDDFDVEW
tara:strand:- start:507 stop:770 length:264 start_codon:yes stop_codon:yes gene_type:complete